MDSVFGVSKKIIFRRNGICALTSFSCITLGTVAKAGAVSPHGSMWPCHGDEVPGGRRWGFRDWVHWETRGLGVGSGTGG